MFNVYNVEMIQMTSNCRKNGPWNNGENLTLQVHMHDHFSIQSIQESCLHVCGVYS